MNITRVRNMAGIEVELFHDAMIIMLILSVATSMFAAFTATTLNTGNVNNSTLEGLNAQLGNINNAGHGINSALNKTVVDENRTDFLYVGEVLLNGIWKFINLGWAIVALLFTDLIAFLTIVYVVIPALLSVSALGSGLGDLIGIIFSVCISILGFYAAYVIAVMLGWRKSSGH